MDCLLFTNITETRRLKNADMLANYWVPSHPNTCSRRPINDTKLPIYIRVVPSVPNMTPPPPEGSQGRNSSKTSEHAREKPVNLVHEEPQSTMHALNYTMLLAGEFSEYAVNPSPETWCHGLICEFRDGLAWCSEPMLPRCDLPCTLPMRVSKKKLFICNCAAMFQKVDGEIKVREHIHPDTLLPSPLCRQGLFLHVAPVAPVTGWNTNVEEPWWHPDGRYCIGRLTKRRLHLRVVNCLTWEEHIIEVPEEERVADILDRVKAFNSNAAAYDWKAIVERPLHGTKDGSPAFVLLDMDRTLLENGVAHLGLDLGLSSDVGVPAVYLHWTDPVSVA
eukprot:jgi/Botrbrau1/6173/Bobra.0344s0014.1